VAPEERGRGRADRTQKTDVISSNHGAERGNDQDIRGAADEAKQITGEAAGDRGDCCTGDDTNGKGQPR